MEQITFNQQTEEFEYGPTQLKDGGSVVVVLTRYGTPEELEDPSNILDTPRKSSVKVLPATVKSHWFKRAIYLNGDVKKEITFEEYLGRVLDGFEDVWEHTYAYAREEFYSVIRTSLDEAVAKDFPPAEGEESWSYGLQRQGSTDDCNKYIAVFRGSKYLATYLEKMISVIV